jgi:hypothetical protein
MPDAGNLRLDPGCEVTIHLLGVEKEVDIMYTFCEVSHLLQGVRLRLHMVGDALPADVDGDCVALTPNMTVSVHSKEYG